MTSDDIKNCVHGCIKTECLDCPPVVPSLPNVEDELLNLASRLETNGLMTTESQAALANEVRAIAKAVSDYFLFHYDA